MGRQSRAAWYPRYARRISCKKGNRLNTCFGRRAAMGVRPALRRELCARRLPAAGGRKARVMNNLQLYLAIGVPMFFNAALIGILVMYINARADSIDKQLEAMRELWRSELHRVEEVLDARLKHLEER
jgi:hypothetical protein